MANNRTERIKKKYGQTCFKRWGRAGGSPVLKAWKEKRVTIHAKRKVQ